jgi:hypothetical protein
MLFDLRGAGRRNTVKAVYLSLALLMGGGLVFFGIGGDVSGGLVDALTDRSAATDTSTDAYRKRAREAEAKARANPQDDAAWAAAARARYQLASAPDFFDPAQRAFTEQGKEQLRLATAAWEKHLALDPDPPDDSVAGMMVQAYSSVGLNELPKAVAAQEVITEERPKSRTFGTLAVLAYQAGQTRKGDLATKQALALADPADREGLKAELEAQKQNSVTQQLQDATAAPTATPTAKSGAGKKKKSKNNEDSDGR